MRAASESGQGLAFKAREIEELADVYFFRPLGMVGARAALALSLSPIQVTLIGSGIGVIGGALLYDPRLGMLAFALLILHGILDSSDGQLARMTGEVSELGRLLDGVGGYVAHAAIYAALISRAVVAGQGGSIVFLAVGAVLSNIVQAQMYDYHRTCYVQYVVTARSRRAATGQMPGALVAALIGAYETAQARIAGRHPEVERALDARAHGGVIRSEDRDRYRASFYWPVRGWNLFGDNTRFYAIGAFALLQHPEWFFLFLVAPMNMALVLVWLWQLAADRRFLARV